MELSNEIKKKIENRQWDNLQICELLKNYLLAYPDMRFGQALANMSVIEYDRTKLTPEVIDPFFEESADTLERVKNLYDKFQNTKA